MHCAPTIPFWVERKEEELCGTKLLYLRYLLAKADQS